jgi:hypothetical protein
MRWRLAFTGAAAALNLAPGAWGHDVYPVDLLPSYTEMGWSGYTALRINDAGRVIIEGPDGTDMLVPPYEIGTPPYTSPNWLLDSSDLVQGMNEAGKMVGYHVEGAFPLVSHLALVWESDGSGRMEIGGGSAQDINESGVIVGHGYDPYGSPLYAWVWPDASSEGAPLPGYEAAVRINNAGVILGTGSKAVVWIRGSGGYYWRRELPRLSGGATSHGQDLADTGWIAGSSDDGTGNQVAVVWAPLFGQYVVAALPAPAVGWTCSEATAVSAHGEIAGNCTNPQGRSRGIVWRVGAAGIVVAHILRPLNRDSDSYVFGLNDVHQAVGRSGNVWTGESYVRTAVHWDLEAVQGVPAPPVPSLGAAGLVLLALSLALAALRAAPGKA